MKTKTLFVCQNCGAQSPRWVGKCSECDAWNSYVEEAIPAKSSGSRLSSVVSKDMPVLLSDVASQSEQRLATGVVEFDRVLGGGIVPGSVILIGGDPGIGKSTLSLQAAVALSQSGARVLYISGEESISQTKMRADRISPKRQESLYIVNQIDLTVISG